MPGTRCSQTPGSGAGRAGKRHQEPGSRNLEPGSQEQAACVCIPSEWPKSQHSNPANMSRGSGRILIVDCGDRDRGSVRESSAPPGLAI